MEIQSNPEFDITQAAYDHTDGDDLPVLLTQLHRKFYAYACAIYDVAAPEYLIHMTCITPQTFRSNFIYIFSDNDRHISLPIRNS